MSTERNKEISLGLIEALNARDLTLWSRHLAHDHAAEPPASPPSLTRAGASPTTSAS
jgi:hypothetical protein